MTILFLCGSLEPAHDGVGDYTRRLAGELMQQGHQAAIVALNDKNLTDAPERLAHQPDREQLVPTLRLSERLSWRERINRAGRFIDAINADIISLQYVPFSFQPKGLPFGFSAILDKLRQGRPLHVMFHEIWLGIQAQSANRHIAWGYVQQRLIRAMLTAQQPVAIHTHAALYQLELERLGIRAARLPLFSNIEVSTIQVRDSREAAGTLRLVLFGGAFPGVPVQALATDVANYAKKNRLNATLTLLGRNGSEQYTWIDAWRSQGLPVQNLGEQAPATISDVLSQSTVGLSTTPVALWSKSSAIAVMHAHGLPVICASAAWQPRRRITLPPAPGIAGYTAGQFAQAMAACTTAAPPPTDVTTVARQLIADLAGAPSPKAILSL